MGDEAQGTPAEEPQAAPAAGKSDKSKVVALILSVLVGSLGIDRFYLGYTGLGILKLITAGGCGIWWLIDLIMIAIGSMKDAQGRELS